MIVTRLRAVCLLAAAGLGLPGCSRLDALNAIEPPARAQASRDVAYGAHPRQKLDLYRPREAGPARPVVIYLYGGSWRSGDRRGYAFIGERFSEAGFLAIVADYRLHPEVTFPAFVEDAAAVVAWAKANAARLGGDPNRIFVLGHSAGAHSAALLATDPRYLARHGLKPEALAGVIGLAGPYAFYPSRYRITRAAFASAAREDETRPVTQAHRAMPPILLLHGRDDTTVDPSNSREFAAAIRAAGGRVELKEYAGTGHIGIMLALTERFRSRAPAFADSVAFMRGAK
jgi:acetyl esterase/lipase